jgi:hypothetical protein
VVLKSTPEQRKHRAELARARYAANPEKRRAAERARYATNPRKMKRTPQNLERKSAYMRKYYQANRPRLLSAIRKRAGVPEPTRPQPERCEVIGCHRKAACADHEHLTGTFRGWLCAPCNLAATKYHTPALLRALADYVERHSCA